MFLSCIYRSPNQNLDEFDNFCVNFDVLLKYINYKFPICSIITGDFNASCSTWWKNDITYITGQEIDSFTSYAGCKQIFDKPTHVVNNSLSCIDHNLY